MSVDVTRIELTLALLILIPGVRTILCSDDIDGDKSKPEFTRVEGVLSSDKFAKFASFSLFWSVTVSAITTQLHHHNYNNKNNNDTIIN